MPSEKEPSVIVQARAVGVAYEARWRHAMNQLETHEYRINQNPLTEKLPFITETDQGTVMKIPIKANFTGQQIMELAEGIEMPVEFITGE